MLTEDGIRIIREFDLDPLVNDSYFRFVHPRRQIYVRDIFRSLPASVDQMWVFGSAVTPNHYSTSDLDILIIGDSLSKEDINKVLCSYHKALSIDTWNKCCDVHIIFSEVAEFEEGRQEWGHCYWNVWKYGVKYFDRSWDYE